ncbi:MAG TPA: GAF domain-containing protein, partial [Ktedonobacterales bacterium]
MTAEAETATLTPGDARGDAGDAPSSPPRRPRKPRAKAPGVKVFPTPETVTPQTDSAGSSATPTPAPRRKRAPKAAPAPQAASETTNVTPQLPPRARRNSAGGRRRESGILGLTERALPERQTLFALPDALLLAAPTIRKALLEGTLESAGQGLTETLALTLAPAIVKLWIVQPTPWTGNASRVGGVELSPSLRLRAQAGFPAELRQAAEGDPGHSGFHLDPLVEEIVATRQPVILHQPKEHPLAREWTALFTQASTSLATLAAYPLRARSKFLGVLAVGTAASLNARQLAAIVELSDLAALSADRDRLLVFSRSQDALAQTVVRHAPVAMAL